MCPVIVASGGGLAPVSSTAGQGVAEVIKGDCGSTLVVPVTDVPEEAQASDVRSTHSVSTSSASSSTKSQGMDSLSLLDDAISDTLGKALDSLVISADKAIPKSDSEASLFDNQGGIAPNISIRAYIRRILRYVEGAGDGSGSWDTLSAGTCALFSALIYLDRISAKGAVTLNSLNVHRLLAVGMLVALKSHEDALVQMPFFAALAGISLKELLKLESAFITLTEWDLVIPAEEFNTRVSLWRKFVERKRRN
jgi:hypothetical protein